jgi:hypothetical protein
MEEKLEAQIKQESRYGSMQFFSRIEYVKYEWRAVPVGCEEQARANEYLDTRAAKTEVVQEKKNPEVKEVVDFDMSGLNASVPKSEQVLDRILSGDEEEEKPVKPTRRTRAK